MILGGPGSLGPVPGAGINLFAFNAQTGLYLGSAHLPEYTDIRTWVVVDGVLYAGVGAGDGGRVVRWRGDVGNPFQFRKVGQLDGNAAYVAYHDNRIFVSAWEGGMGGGGSVSGLWMSPEIPLEV